MILLRNRGFLLLWSGQTLTFLADFSLRTVLLIWAYALTHSGAVVGLVGLTEALPLLVLSPIAGAYVDRWHRARTMTGAVLVRAALILPLFLVTSRAALPLLLVVTLLANAAGQFFVPAAAAAVPVIVGQEKVGQANSLLSVMNGVLFGLGPGAASLVYGVGGPRTVLLVLLALYLISAPIVAKIPAPKSVGRSGVGASMRSEIVDGLSYLRRHPMLLTLLAVVFVFMLGFGALTVIDVVFVTRALHMKPSAVGVLLASSGVGELSGGVVLTLVSGWAASRYHRLLGMAVVMCGLALVVYALAPSLPVAVAALCVVGFSFPPVVVGYSTIVQLVAEDAFMGRVTSLMSTSMAVAMVASLGAGGVLTDAIGVRQTIAAGAALIVVSGVLSVLTIRSTPKPRGRTTAEEVSAASEPVEGLAVH